MGRTVFSGQGQAVSYSKKQQRWVALGCCQDMIAISEDHGLTWQGLGDNTFSGAAGKGRAVVSSSPLTSGSALRGGPGLLGSRGLRAQLQQADLRHLAQRKCVGLVSAHRLQQRGLRHAMGCQEQQTGVLWRLQWPHHGRLVRRHHLDPCPHLSLHGGLCRLSGRPSWCSLSLILFRASATALPWTDFSPLARTAVRESSRILRTLRAGLSFRRPSFLSQVCSDVCSCSLHFFPPQAGTWRPRHPRQRCPLSCLRALSLSPPSCATPSSPSVWMCEGIWVW